MEIIQHGSYHHRFGPAALGHIANDADAPQRGSGGCYRSSARADTDNPRGYYEFEQVKKIANDSSWLPQTRGKAFKMVSQLLYDLPASEQYRILFMERDFEEMLLSQEKMLERLGRPAAPRRDETRLYHASRSPASLVGRNSLTWPSCVSVTTNWSNDHTIWHIRLVRFWAVTFPLKP